MISALIGGTGCQSLLGKHVQRKEVATPYGKVLLGEMHREKGVLYILLRHGEGHRTPPHLIPYRAQISALKQLGVTQAIGIYAVGSITSKVLPGSIGLVDQFIDFTGGSRESTFYTGNEMGVKHVPMIEPYSVRLRNEIAQEAHRQGIPLSQKGTYVCTQGPRLETPAEIAVFRRWGADYVGMTATTETTLAHEANIEFAGIVYSINWAAGLDAEGISFIEEEIHNKIILQITSLCLAVL